MRFNLRSLVVSLVLLLTAHCSLLTAFAQDTPGTVKFPVSIDSSDSLFRAADSSRSQITEAMTSSSSSVNVTNTTTFPTTGSMKIDDEIIFYTSKTSSSFGGLVRGAAGTSAGGHVSGARIFAPMLAAHHNVLALAIVATQTKVGEGSSIPANNAALVGTGEGSSSWQVQPALNGANFTNLNAASVVQDSTHRLATDAEKAIWNAKQDALGFTAVPNTRTVNGHPLSSNVTVTPGDLGLVIGADVEAYDADLLAIAGLTPANDDLVQRKAGAWVNRTPAQLKTDLALAKGDVGLGNVDNTSDVNKPVSTATQTALDAKVPNTRTVNGHALSTDVSVAWSDLVAPSVDLSLNTGTNRTTFTSTGNMSTVNPVTLFTDNAGNTSDNPLVKIETKSADRRPLLVYASNGAGWVFNTEGSLVSDGGSYLRIADGVGSLPGLSFSTDVGTGFYRPADHEVGIMTNGVNAMTVAQGGVTVPGTINKVRISPPAAGATLTIADGKTLLVPNNATVSGTNTGDQDLSGLLNDSVAYCADAGANDAYACSLSPAPSGYVTGARYRFKANTANSGAATIDLNSLGAKTIKKAAGGITTDLVDNDIRVGQVVDLVYDGTNMQMQSTLGNAGSGGGGCTATLTMSILLSSTTVNLNEGTGAKQPLYTCPAARVCLLTNIMVHHSSTQASGLMAGSLGWTAEANGISANASAIGGMNALQMLNSTAVNGAFNGFFDDIVYPIGSAGDVLGLKVTTPNGSAMTARVDVYGYLTDTSGVPVANVCGP